MRKTIFAAALVVASLLLMMPDARAQPSPAADWSAWQPLVGNWVADPMPDGAVGSFSFTPDLQKRVLVRKNVADYPKTTRAHHEDLMVVYQDGATTRADYWDNEGHVIHYVATVADGGKKYTFVSDASAGRPRFRLTYTMTGAGALALAFDMAMPNAPDAWKPYIQATAHKSAQR